VFVFNDHYNFHNYSFKALDFKQLVEKLMSSLIRQCSAMEFYEKYGNDFSKSRFRIWPQVRAFVESLPARSVVLDIGCGNGKNMTIRDDIQIVGMEPSAALCAATVAKGLTAVQADARALPCADETVDAVLMIAVLHHMPPEEQIKALFEIQRVLKPGGEALITVWAVEQPPDAKPPRTFVKGLNYVKWTGKEDAPLPYWILDAESAQTMALPPQLIRTSLVWNAGNWNFTLVKT